MDNPTQMTAPKEKSSNEMEKSNNGVEKSKTITRIVVNVDEQRIKDMVLVDEYIRVREGDLLAIVKLCSKVMWDEEAGKFWEPAEAEKALRKLSIGQLQELASDVTRTIEEDAVPKEIEGE